MHPLLPLRQRWPLRRALTNALYDLPAPASLNAWWNFGSLLGLFLAIQIITGLFLSIHYNSSTDLAFASYVHIKRDVVHGWLFQSAHSVGARFLFICIYLHLARGLYFGLWTKTQVWIFGWLLFVLAIATAFIGYVLPWGQIRFWGATVITNLVSTIPLFGNRILSLLWGGFAVSGPTLSRFFTFHFILPAAMLLCALLHLFALHATGSGNPVGISGNPNKILFHPYYTRKDTFGFFLFGSLFFLIVCFAPSLFSEPDNWILADPLVTPEHITPEWYFLWAYAILRGVPRKGGGVFLLFAAVCSFLILPLVAPSYRARTIMRWAFPWLVCMFVLLTWLGGQPVTPPVITLSQFCTLGYFSLILLLPLLAQIIQAPSNKDPL